MEVETKLTVKDMYRFNLYHTYTSFQGLFTIVLGLGVIGLAIYAKDVVSIRYMLIYLLMGVIFLFYTPITLYLSSKSVIHKSGTFRHAMNYRFSEEGALITVVGVKREELLGEDDGEHRTNEELFEEIQKQEEASVKVPWNLVYKLIQTKHNLLIYTSRRNAYIVPMRDMKPHMKAFCPLAKAHLQKYQYRFKK